MAPFSKIEADRGDTNIYDLDANVPLDPVLDKIWFTLKRRFLDDDADAVVRLGLNVATLAGIVVTSAPNGQFQVVIPRDKLETVTDKALMYDCQLYDASQQAYFTVRQGVCILSGQVTEST